MQVEQVLKTVTTKSVVDWVNRNSEELRTTHRLAVNRRLLSRERDEASVIARVVDFLLLDVA